MPSKLFRSAAALAAGLTVFALTACGGEVNTKSTPAPAEPPVSTAPASPNAGSASPDATVTVTESAAGSQAPSPAPQQGSQFPTGQQVAISAFEQQGSHLWQSPTGRIFCGVLPMDGYVMAGCQMMSALPECGDNPDVKAPIVHWGREQTLTQECTTQGIFVSSASKVLEYGQQIAVGQYTAVSQQDGMYMRHNETGKAFKIAVEGIQTFQA